MIFENAETDNFIVDQRGIESERIVDDEYRLADELICSICRGVVWRARSCGSCQNLFCQSCIQTWQQIHSNSCPFRCSPFDEKRAPPAIQSLLTRLKFRCRNHSFGCNEIRSYEYLEQHETNECEYQTRTCRICRTDIPLEQIPQHEQQCQSSTSICPICRQDVDRNEFNEHLTECLEDRVTTTFNRILPETNPTTNFAQQIYHRLLNFLAHLPREDLIGFAELQQTRNANLSLRISTMFRFLRANRSKIPQILLELFCVGIGLIIGLFIVAVVHLRNRMERSITSGLIQTMIFSGFVVMFTQGFLTLFTDRWIILLFAISFPLISSTVRELPVDFFRIIYDVRIAYFGLIVVFLLTKIFLLMIRFYFSTIPTYITAGLFAWLLVFVNYHFRRNPFDDL